MRGSIFVLALLIAGPAGALDDVIRTPDTATASWRAQIQATGAPAVAVGLADCGATPQTIADLEGVVTLPAPANDVIVSGTVSFDPMEGDKCFHAYAAGENGRLSAASLNSQRVLLRPLPVIFVE
ncbi:MAG: hypothetical protein KAJ19_29825 [Gammaproteobacteria bacterium]|nr:hypothetical protein [Gammaproteobacteria bacterium]